MVSVAEAVGVVDLLARVLLEFLMEDGRPWESLKVAGHQLGERLLAVEVRPPSSLSNNLTANHVQRPDTVAHLLERRRGSKAVCLVAEHRLTMVEVVLPSTHMQTVLGLLMGDLLEQ